MSEYEQWRTGIILAIIFIVFFVGFKHILSKWPDAEPSPIESTILRQDDCTVIKTLLTDSQYIFVSVCDITVIGEE